MSGLPEGWDVSAIGDILDGIKAGKNLRCKERPPTSSERGVVKVSAVSRGEFDDTQSKTLPVDFVPDPDTKIREGDLLFSRANTLELVGAIAMVHDAPRNLFLSDKVLRLDAPEDLKPWILKFLRSSDGRSALESAASGNQHSMRNIGQAALKQIKLPLPPLAEQRRIVEKLDQLSARTRAARDHLAHVQTLATRAKQATLAAAFGGSFEKIELGELAEEVRYGTSKKCGYNLGSTPVLRIPNVAGGKIDGSDLKSADFEVKEIDKLSLQAGDLLVIRSNGSVDLVGRSALVEDEHAGYLFAGYLIRVRLKRARVHPEYVHKVLVSNAARQFIERLAKSTSGVNNINSAQIASIPIPLPPLTEQTEIVRRIEAAFARIDRMVSEATRAAKLLERLEQQLLAKAFRGELVPQDPDDEPASALLARIREARANAPKPKRRRKVKTTTV